MIKQSRIFLDDPVISLPVVTLLLWGLPALGGEGFAAPFPEVQTKSFEILNRFFSNAASL